MKKSVAFILSLFYLITSAGAMVHFHYCSAQFADGGLGNAKPEACNNCGKEDSDAKKIDCCKEEYSFIKANTDQNIVESPVHVVQNGGIALSGWYTGLFLHPAYLINRQSFPGNGPPRLKGAAIYLLNRTFLI